MPKDYYAEEIENITPTRDYYAEEIEEIEKKPISKVRQAIGLYFKEAQPAFKFAIRHPYELMTGKAGELPPKEFEDRPWSDIYREAELPFSKSKTTAGQLIPETAGTLLDIGTRPSAYIAPKAMEAGLIKATQIPTTRRFLELNIPTLAKPLLEKYPIKPIMKETPYGKMDITKPLPFQATKTPQLMGKDYTLDRVEQAVNLVDSKRTELGTAVKETIAKVGNKTINIQKLSSELPPMPKEVIKSLEDPIYGINKLPDGSLEPTISNMNRVKEALGDLMTSKLWEEATTKNKQIIKQSYGLINKAMKEAEPSLETPLNNYHDFMELYRNVNRITRDTTGTILEKRTRTGLKLGAERQYQKSWEKLSEQIPALKQIAKDIVKYNARQKFKKGMVKSLEYIGLAGGVLSGLRWLGRQMNISSGQR